MNLISEIEQYLLPITQRFPVYQSAASPLTILKQIIHQNSSPQSIIDNLELLNLKMQALQKNEMIQQEFNSNLSKINELIHLLQVEQQQKPTSPSIGNSFTQQKQQLEEIIQYKSQELEEKFQELLQSNEQKMLSYEEQIQIVKQQHNDLLEETQKINSIINQDLLGLNETQQQNALKINSAQQKQHQIQQIQCGLEFLTGEVKQLSIKSEQVDQMIREVKLLEESNRILSERVTALEKNRK